MVKKPIYVDNHATTRTDPRVVDAMLPYFTEHFGNAASRTHGFGWQAADAVDTARTQVAALVGARATEIVFTSGATEGINLAASSYGESFMKKGDVKPPPCALQALPDHQQDPAPVHAPAVSGCLHHCTDLHPLHGYQDHQAVPML